MTGKRQSGVSKNTMKAIVKGSIIMIAVPLLPILIIVGYFLLADNSNKTVTDTFTSPDNTYILYTVDIENESTYNETAMEVIFTNAAELPVVGQVPPKGGSTLISGYESFTYEVIFSSDTEFTVRITEPSQIRELDYVYANGSFVKYNERAVNAEE